MEQTHRAKKAEVLCAASEWMKDAGNTQVPRKKEALWGERRHVGQKSSLHQTKVAALRER